MLSFPKTKTQLIGFLHGVLNCHNWQQSKYQEVTWFQHLELLICSDNSHDVISAVPFLRTQISSPSGEIKTVMTFFLGKARLAPFKVMTVPKLEHEAAFAARLRREICRSLNVSMNKFLVN